MKRLMLAAIMLAALPSIAAGQECGPDWKSGTGTAFAYWLEVDGARASSHTNSFTALRALKDTLTNRPGAEVRVKLDLVGEYLGACDFAAGDTVVVTDTLLVTETDTLVVTDTVEVEVVVVETDTVTVTDTVAVGDTVRLEAYPVRGPLPEKLERANWGTITAAEDPAFADSALNVYWRDACPVYSITGPGDPWAVEVAPGQYSTRSPCPPILQDAWRVVGGISEPVFDRVLRSDVTNVTLFGLEPGTYWVCMSRVFGFRPELAEHDSTGRLVLSAAEIVSLAGVHLSEQDCISRDLPIEAGGT